MLELERDRDRNRQPVSVCVFPNRVFLFLLLIFLRQFIPLGSPFEALDDERFKILQFRIHQLRETSLEKRLPTTRPMGDSLALPYLQGR